MKDVIDGVAIKEFVGLRTKMYSLLTTNKKETKYAKGVKRSWLNIELNTPIMSIASSMSAHIYTVSLHLDHRAILLLG